MTPEEEALRDAFLAECWPVCREVPLTYREEKRKADRAEQRRLEESALEASTAHTQASTACAQTCAQNGPENASEKASGARDGMRESSCRNSSAPGIKCANTRPGPDPRVSEGYQVITAHPPDHCQQVGA